MISSVKHPGAVVLYLDTWNVSVHLDDEVGTHHCIKTQMTLGFRPVLQCLNT